MTHGLWAHHQGSVDHLAQLVPLLHECASHVTEGSFEKADFTFKKIRMLTFIADGPLQRLSTIIVDSLAHRLLFSIQGLSGALIDPFDYIEQTIVQAARYNFFNLNPFLSTGFVTINRAIMEAMEDEKVVHIVDLSCSAAHPWQWVKILQDFHGRPGGPPELYLTVLHDDHEFLANMQTLLSKKAESLEVPFRFISVKGRLETLDLSNLRDTFQIKFGGAVAISCALQLHHLLLVDDNLSSTSIAQLQQMANFTQLKQMASTVCSPASTLNYLQTPSPHTPKLLARLLSVIRALKPNIMVIMEQDANHNTLLFRDRFNEVLNYYAALFDSFHAVAAANPQRVDERLRVERMILREEIKNILVCEGVHRHERHERLDQWAMHMEESGFHNVQLSFSAIREGKENLLSFGLKDCQNKEDRGCLLLCWGSTNLYSISAWRPNKGSASGSREHMLVQRQILWPAQ